MNDLRVLYLQGNPVVKLIRHYRKTLVSRCANLKYLDDRYAPRGKCSTNVLPSPRKLSVACTTYFPVNQVKLIWSTRFSFVLSCMLSYTLCCDYESRFAKSLQQTQSTYAYKIKVDQPECRQLPCYLFVEISIHEACQRCVNFASLRVLLQTRDFIH